MKNRLKDVSLKEMFSMYFVRISRRQILAVAILVFVVACVVVYEMDKDAKVAEELETALLDPIEMDDDMVVNYLKYNFLIPPSPRDVPYNMGNPNALDCSHGQAARVLTILNDMRDGFFVECGAHTGEEASNTFIFEHGYNWSGLLIEPSPESFKELSSKRRKAYTSPSCLSRKNRTEKVTFLLQGNGGHIVQSQGESREKNVIEVQCFPLYSYLLALNRTTIDYFSLDVESNELDVLKTIPWDKVNIRILSVEYYMVPEGKEVLREYMEQQGYYVDSTIEIGRTHGAADYIFVKEGLVV